MQIELEKFVCDLTAPTLAQMYDDIVCCGRDTLETRRALQIISMTGDALVGHEKFDRMLEALNVERLVDDSN